MISGHVFLGCVSRRACVCVFVLGGWCTCVCVVYSVLCQAVLWRAFVALNAILIVYICLSIFRVVWCVGEEVQGVHLCVAIFMHVHQFNIVGNWLCVVMVCLGGSLVLKQLYVEDF